jgi:hypothetical protein
MSQQTEKIVQDETTTNIMAHIERVIACLREDDLTTTRDYLIIRNTREYLLIQDYRTRKMQKAVMKMRTEVSSVNRARETSTQSVEDVQATDNATK